MYLQMALFCFRLFNMGKTSVLSGALFFYIKAVFRQKERRITMKTILVKSDQSACVYEINSVADIYTYFGGFAETVTPRRLEQPYCILVDDMGTGKELPPNAFGSFLYETNKHGNPVLGDLFIMKKVWGDDGYDLTGLTESEIAYIIEKYS